MFEDYINNRFPAFEQVKDEEERKIAKLLFKLSELEEYQKTARAYHYFIGECWPESELDKENYFSLYGKIEGILVFLSLEIDATKKSLNY